MDLQTRPDLIEAIRKMKEMGIGYRGIAAELETKYSYKTSHQTIKNFIDAGGLLEQDKSMQDAKDVLDVLKQLKDINKKMWKLFDEVSKEESEKGGPLDKFGYARANILNKILTQMEFQRKMLDKLTSSTVTQKISYLEFSVKVTKYLEILEKEGYIKIIKKPLKVYNE